MKPVSRAAYFLWRGLGGNAILSGNRLANSWPFDVVQFQVYVHIEMHPVAYATAQKST